MERTYTTAGVQLVQNRANQLMMTHYLFLASRDEIKYLILNILAAYTSLTWKGSTSFC